MTTPSHRRALRRRLVYTAAALAVIGAPAIAPTAIGTATAAPSQMAATSAPAAFDLAGTVNTRTFTNYHTADGQSINGRVIRSDSLDKLTAADQKKLAGHRVTSIIDFRSDVERAVQPDRAVPGATAVNYNVFGSPVPISVDSGSAGLTDTESQYREFVTSASARDAFRKTLLDIKSTAGKGDTVLYHCTAGKDRTGWASAVLLSILGVDRSTVEQDYLASNTFRHADAGDSLNGVNISSLRAAFAAADKTYGSFDNYVSKGLGLTAGDIAGLKKGLLVKHA
ncbi:tyrosine-protein phosphatase [Gordonia hankookensis]|uniref:Tyrosine-protein phosphatase n=1 Tax=Gordonia hankookensis TaxID=589403 RepID=A0ABR7WG67_9ACTN|nr:tyrosine-protein phosphatase [Gordonia hankookensis]MBD1321759.1 tyrosine-protein phosphatase [Gordonia hankookensis]